MAGHDIAATHAERGRGSKEQERMPQLDGLRALAILLVIGFHRGYAEWGWSGVQIFFVLSGFLITAILRRSRHDRYFWGPFYLKRVTRILPPLVVFFLLVTRNGQISWHTTGLSYVFFLANFIQAIPTTPLNNVGVTWSLAVEEHFYFLWPFAVRYLSRRTLMVLAGGIVLLSPLARALATSHISTWRPIYYWTPFQIDGLALGALLALLLEVEGNRKWMSRVAWPAVAVPLTLLALLSRYSWYRYTANSELFNGSAYSLLVLASAGLLIVLVLQPRSLVSKVFAMRPLVFVGLVSYGLYLYHLPVIEPIASFLMKRHFMDLQRSTMVGIVVALLFSWLSFRYYEQPIVRWGRRRAQALNGNKTPSYLRP